MVNVVKWFKPDRCFFVLVVGLNRSVYFPLAHLNFAILGQLRTWRELCFETMGVPTCASPIMDSSDVAPLLMVNSQYHGSSRFVQCSVVITNRAII